MNNQEDDEDWMEGVEGVEESDSIMDTSLSPEASDPYFAAVQTPSLGPDSLWPQPLQIRQRYWLNKSLPPLPNQRHVSIGDEATTLETSPFASESEATMFRPVTPVMAQSHLDITAREEQVDVDQDMMTPTGSPLSSPESRRSRSRLRGVIPGTRRLRQFIDSVRSRSRSASNSGSDRASSRSRSDHGSPGASNTFSRRAPTSHPVDTALPTGQQVTHGQPRNTGWSTYLSAGPITCVLCDNGQIPTCLLGHGPLDLAWAQVPNASETIHTSPSAYSDLTKAIDQSPTASPSSAIEGRTGVVASNSERIFDAESGRWLERWELGLSGTGGAHIKLKASSRKGGRSVRPSPSKRTLRE